MTVHEALLLSWQRQSQCLRNLMTLMTPELMDAKASEEGWSIAFHLCHIHEVRCDWLGNVVGTPNAGIDSLYYQVDGKWAWSKDITEIGRLLDVSEKAVAEWVSANLELGGPVGNYEHPVMYLQHMIWHEGYHFGLLVLALRLAGVDPTDEWEENNVWSNWRESDWVPGG